MKKVEVAFWREGVAFEAHFGSTIPDNIAKVVADRMELADNFIVMASKMHASRSDLARAAISRYYYGMYHAMRAVVYFATSGDDHEAHSELHKAIPADFPNSALAQNNLKSAREWRNEADYEPYPSDPQHFKAVQKTLAPVARSFVADCRNYLKSKGNVLV